MPSNAPCLLPRPSPTLSPPPPSSAMPSLSLDDFGALVAASLDGPALPLDLHIPAGLQRGLSRSRSRPSLPTLFRRPSPLNLPLALSPTSDAQPAAFSPRSFQSSFHHNEASRPETFTLPRTMGQSPLLVSPPSISSPISATYTLESSAFGSPPRAPPTPPSRMSHSSSNVRIHPCFSQRTYRSLVRAAKSCAQRRADAPAAPAVGVHPPRVCPI
jgi:hypothetical protein